MNHRSRVAAGSGFRPPTCQDKTSYIWDGNKDAFIKWTRNFNFRNVLEQVGEIYHVICSAALNWQREAEGGCVKREHYPKVMFQELGAYPGGHATSFLESGSTLSTAGNPMSSSERPSPEPLLKKRRPQPY